MPMQAKHAHGSRYGVANAIAAGKVNQHDLLLLSGENEEPAIGWVDKNNNPIIIECGVQQITGDSLPETGVEGKVYIFENTGYIWNGAKFVELAKDTDLSNLEASMDSLAVMIADKVDAETVDSKIEKALDSSLAIVEF